MFPNVLAHVPSSYHREVSLETVHQRPTSLAYILSATSLARDAVDKIGTLASYILLTFIPLVGGITSYAPTVVNLGAVLAIPCQALVDG